MFVRFNLFGFMKNNLIILACISTLVTGGCATYRYEAKPLETKQIVNEFSSRSLADPKLREFMQTYQYSTRDWPLQKWDLEALTLAAFYFHPAIQVAIAEYAKSKTHEETINQLINPGIHLPLEYHSDTSGGKSPWLIGLIFDFIIERQGKRQARYEQAHAETNVARLGITSTAWKIYSNLRQKYLDYYAAVKNRELLNKQEQNSEKVLSLVTRRRELGQASEFEVDSTRLQLQRIRLEKTSQEIIVTDAFQALAGSIGIPASALDENRLLLADVDGFSNVGGKTLEQLREIALLHRLDIQKAIENYAAFEAALKLEIEKQYPDITLSPGFIFDQGDKIWALGASWILPLFHPQNEGPIREALATRDVKQAEFLALQANVINEISAAFARYKARVQALNQARQLLKEIRERHEQLQKQYDLGYLDLLALQRSVIEVSNAEKALSDIRYSVIQSVGELEDTLQYPQFTGDKYQYRVHTPDP